MKNIFIIIAITFCNSSTTMAQVIEKRFHTNNDDQLYTFYLDKATEQNTLGNLFLKGGAFFTIIGIDRYISTGLPFSYDKVGSFLIYAGGLAIIASIPLKISSHENGKMAALYFRNEKISMYNIPQAPRHSMPAVGVSLPVSGKKAGKRNRKESLWLVN